MNIDRITDALTANAVNAGSTRSSPRNNAGRLDFSSILADTLQNKVVENAVALGGSNADMNSLLGGSGFSPTGGIEQIILAAAATGEVSKAEVALFMLCSMMQSSADGEFAQLFGMMASMLGSINGDVGALRDSVMHSAYSPYTLSRIDSNVFFPGTQISPSGAVLPSSAWVPVTPAVVSLPGERDPRLLRAVIDQFNVERAERYRPGKDGYTYCNIFVWDVTRALGCEIPHFVDPATGNPMQYPDISGANSLGAIAMERWLAQHGGRYGWREADAETAQRYANEGKAAVTTAGTIGHVQVVCPSYSGEYDPAKGVTIAQAGSRVTNFAYITEIYRGDAMNRIRYFVHE